MVDVYSEEHAQHAVGEISRMILALVERLEEIAGSLHEPADAEAMYNGEKPYGVAVDLRGAIECSISETSGLPCGAWSMLLGRRRGDWSGSSLSGR